MKDATATLRRIDEEITAKRQQIARLRNDIGQLEDARLVFLGMAEADQAARHAGAAAQELLAPGSHARPQLIVRPTGSGNGDAKRKKRRRPAGTLRQEFANRISEELADGAALTSTELGDRFGLKIGKPRHDLRQALRSMIDAGELVRSGNGRNYAYSLPGGHA